MAIAPIKPNTMFDPMPSELAPAPPMEGAPAYSGGAEHLAPPPDTSGMELSGAAPATVEQPKLAPMSKTGLEGKDLHQEGQARHAAQLQDFADQKSDNLYQHSLLRVTDPDYYNKLMKLNADRGKIKEDEAVYKEMHPWGSMESSHPGVFGKIGHAFGQIGNVAGEALAPGLAEAIPGSHANLEAEKAAGASEQQAALKGYTEAEAAGLTGQKAVTEAAKPELMAKQGEAAGAKAGLDVAKTGAVGEPTKPDEQVLAAGQRIAQGIGTAKDFAMVKSFHDLQQMKNEAKIKNAPANIKAEYEQAVKDGDDAKAQQLLGIAHQYATATQPPQRPPQELVVEPGAEGQPGTAKTLRPGESVAPGTRGAKEALRGATIDEERRADLARNMNENMDQLEEIAKRRPDLFGPAAGRLTATRQFIGTSDQDIGALNTIKEQMGMAMVGAHAMRNAQHVEAAANSIINSFKNQPEVVMESIKKARQSLKTFQQDAGEQPGSAPKNAPKGGGSEIHYKIVNGQLVKQ